MRFRLSKKLLFLFVLCVILFLLNLFNGTPWDERRVTAWAKGFRKIRHLLEPSFVMEIEGPGTVQEMASTLNQVWVRVELNNACIQRLFPIIAGSVLHRLMPSFVKISIIV